MPLHGAYGLLMKLTQLLTPTYTYTCSVCWYRLYISFFISCRPPAESKDGKIVGSLEDEVTACACKYIMWAHSYILYSAGAGAEEDDGGDG